MAADRPGTGQPGAKAPNLILRRIREQERHETREEFADAMAHAAQEMGESVSPDAKYVAKLETGDIKYPGPTYRRILASLCGRPFSELGFSPAPGLSLARHTDNGSTESGTTENANPPTEMNVALRNAVMASGLELPQIARKVGVDPKTVQRWITRGVVPHPRHRWRTSEVLGRDESGLWPTVSSQSQIGPATGSSVSQSANAAASEKTYFDKAVREIKYSGHDMAILMTSLNELGLPDDLLPESGQARERQYDRFVELFSRWANTMERRELLRLVGWAASAAAAKTLYGQLNSDEQIRVTKMLDSPNRVDDSIIGHMEDVLWRLIHQDDALGAQATLDTVLAQRNLVRLILPECPSRLRPRLLSLFSNYSLQAGWVFYDLTDFDSASYYYEHARTIAHEAENTELGALVLCTMSHLATWRGQPRVGIDHAVAAQGWATLAGKPRLKAYAADVAARAFALEGQRSACMQQLEIAETNLAVDGSDASQSRMYFYTPGQLAGTTSHCLLQLGDVKEAIEAGEKSLDMVDSSFVRNLAFTKLFLGDAYAAGDQVDHAADIIGEAAPLAAQNQSARLLERLRSTRQKLSPLQQSSAVRQLDEKLRVYNLNR